jgi:hypothetical protein
MATPKPLLAMVSSMVLMKAFITHITFFTFSLCHHFASYHFAGYHFAGKVTK